VNVALALASGVVVGSMSRKRPLGGLLALAWDPLSPGVSLRDNTVAQKASTVPYSDSLQS
jgi:hypothetical protein